jgi:serine phosphatase RsbU (regulator of sigma subunit)/anti-sigma regulatory factor (Ser/Thr protein kinase)
MLNTGASLKHCDFRDSLRLEVDCAFSAVRTAVAQICSCLAKKNLPEADLGAWELALIEAVNNAVKYAPPAARELPVIIEMSCGERDIEARITDHTAGFDWPDDVKLPAEESESGRGLFLMKSLTDRAIYYRHPGENVLVLRRARPPGCGKIPAEDGQLQRQLAEAEGALNDMTAELASSYESLVAMFRYSSELGAQTDVEDFSQRLLRDLMQIAEADGAVLRLVSADGKKLEPLTVLPENGRAAVPAIEISPDSSAVEIGAARNRQDIWFSPEEPLAEDDPLRAVMPVGNGVCHAFFVADQLVGTAALGRLAANKPVTAAQVNLLHTFIDFLAIQIVNARLHNERTIARVTRRELEIAADIQRSLLPARLPDCPPFALAAECESAQQVGGDFYDAIPAGDGAVLLVIADVMGKGVPAALFAAVLRSTIRSMCHLFAQPGELLGAVNKILFSDLSRVNMFITAQIVYLDPPHGKMISASAGHCPLLVWHPGEARAAAPGQSGFPLGIDPQSAYPQTTIALPPGAAALLYTDGLSELRDPAGKMLGENKLPQFLAEAAGQSTGAENAKRILLQWLAAYRGDAPLSDDQTFILIRHLK